MSVKGMVCADRVNRFFNIALHSPEGRFSIDHLDRHDEVLDALLGEENAREAFSGHTGYWVVLENDRRPDAEIIESLERRIAPYWEFGKSSEPERISRKIAGMLEDELWPGG